MKKFLDFLKKLLFAENYPLVRNIVSGALYVLSLLVLDLGFRYVYKGSLVSPAGDAVPVYFTLAWIAILTGISFLLPRLARRIYQIATVSVYALFSLVHAFFFSFNGTYLTLSSAIFAGDGAAFFDWSYFSISKKFVLLLLGVVFLAVISALILPKTKYGIVRIICAALSIVAGITGTFLIKNTFFTEEEGALVWNSARTPLEIYDSFSDTRACMHMLGLYQYTFTDLMNVTGASDLLEGLQSGDTVEALDSYYNAKAVDPDNEMTGIFKDKNLILIQLESIDTWMVNEISMPFLTSLQQKGMNFTNFYAPKFLAASTFNTETIVNTGLITPMNSAKLAYFTDNYYPYSAANLFKDAGYTAESFHRSNGNIYNRGDAHINWGYTAYNNYLDMGMENADLDTDIMDGYEKIVRDGKFMSFIITYSGHGPYSGESVEVERYYDIIKPALPADAEEEYVYALCHAYETDRFIKMLYEQLQADGLLEDTVLVLYSDHYDHYITDNNILVKYKNGTDSNLWCNIPFIIYNEGTSPVTVDKVISTFDVLPTVVNLFDLNTDGRYYVGNDAFSEGGGYAFFSNNSYVDKNGYFNVNASAPTEESRKMIGEITERLNMNWDTVKTDYFAKKRK